MQRLKETHAPWLLPMHCMAHRVNLVSGGLSDCSLMVKLEYAHAKIYTYFSHRLVLTLSFVSSFPRMMQNC